MKRTRYFGIVVVLLGSFLILYTYKDWSIAQTTPTPTSSIKPTALLENYPALEQSPISDMISGTPVIPLILDPPSPATLSTPIQVPTKDDTLQPIPTLRASPTSIFDGEADLQMTTSTNALISEMETENEDLRNQVISLEQRVLLLSALLLTTVLMVVILIASNIHLKRKLLANNVRVARPNPPRAQPRREPVREKKKTRDAPRSDELIITSPGEWVIVGASVIGKDHIRLGKPCQDSFHYELLRNGWGIAIVADGAGSAQNSHLGSAFVAKEAARRYFGDLIVKQGWYMGKNIPSEEEWQELANNKWKEVRGDLEGYAKREDLDAKSLACTAIVAVFSPTTILVTHIGDGRAGYRNDKEEWKPLIKPYKGEEANSTIFLTSISWREESPKYIESKIINDQITAFTLMSDGCEKHAFECSKVDADGNWSDPNLPYSRFFESLANNLLQMKTKGINPKVMHEKWETFLESGTEGLENEADDKTLILGVLAS